MEIKEVMGIDASKLTLDCCIHGTGQQEIFAKDFKKIEEMIRWVFANIQVPKEQVLFVFEHTGLYSH